MEKWFVKTKHMNCEHRDFNCGNPVCYHEDNTSDNAYCCIESCPISIKSMKQFDCKHLHDIFKGKDDMCPYCSKPFNENF